MTKHECPRCDGTGKIAPPVAAPALPPKEHAELMAWVKQQRVQCWFCGGRGFIEDEVIP